MARSPAPRTGPATRRAGLRGLGPKSLALLEAAGIHTIADLRRLGAVAAYAKARACVAAGGATMRPSLNLLWALEGALTGLSWQQVAREHRLSLMLALEALEGDEPRRSAAP